LKLGGVLGETDGLGTPDPRLVVGMGINVDWAAADFPADIAPTMTSLREVAGGRPIAADDLLAAFLAALEDRIGALRDGAFDVEAWQARQVTTGRRVRVELPDGRVDEVRATGVDEDSGALVVDSQRRVLSADIHHLRPAGV
jgi:BirA family biotin operon repressor/biotin-[acetyl-CoA-carboxylase] ligase